MKNAYSRNWFEFFHEAIPNDRTAKEVELVCTVAPLPEFRRVLDLGCGTGRHSRALSERGYVVTGVDRDASAIAKARETRGGPRYEQADMRDYEPAVGAFDLAVSMSQSFGYFDSETNRDVLTRLSAGLPTGGRMVLDLWNPEFFAAHQGERDLIMPRGLVRERKHVVEGRLLVHLAYPNEAEDSFDFQLFSPREMEALAQRIGLRLALVCTAHDPAQEPNASNPRIQFVLEKVPL